MRLALDTNILVYAEGINDASRSDMAKALIAQLPVDRVIVPAQVLAELYRVLVGKAGWSGTKARAATLAWTDIFDVSPTSQEVVASAADIAAAYQVQIFDAIVLASAAEAGCRLLLSEDMQHGFTWQGVTVTNPFISTRDPLLEVILER